MKTTSRTNGSFLKGIKLTLLTILLQSTVLGLALVMKANDLLPADFVNYSDRVTSKDSPADVLKQRSALKKNKSYVMNSASQNEQLTDDFTSETSDIVAVK